MLSLPFLEKFFGIQPCLFEDFVDRIHRSFTVRLLLFFALTVSWKINAGGFRAAISCWTPFHFEKSWDEYVHDYCLSNGLYVLPLNQSTAASSAAMKIHYYQWMACIFAGMSFIFYLPHFVWTNLMPKQGLNIQRLLLTGREIASERENSVRTKGLEKLYAQFSESFGLRNVSLLSRKGSSVTTLAYIVVKLFCLLNVLAQLFTMNYILRIQNTFWGFQILVELIGGVAPDTGIFPRIGLCDFAIRAEIANIQSHTVQCVLPINALIEKLFVVLWFWFIFVAAITLFNLAFWLIVSFSNAAKLRFVRKLIDSIDDIASESELAAATCLLRILPADALLFLRFLQSRADDSVCCYLLQQLLIQDRNSGAKEQDERFRFASPILVSCVLRKRVATTVRDSAMPHLHANPPLPLGVCEV